MTRKITKICVVTGTRADYGIYIPLLEKLQIHHRFELSILAAGMHLSPAHGHTINEIKRDGFNITGKVDTILINHTEGNMAKSIGMGILGMTQHFETQPPDLVIILGDRGEMLAAAIAAAHLNIPVAHLHGGEISGSIDESVRHAITKLSHIHFPATSQSAARIQKLGEDPWRIFNVGSLRVEQILSGNLPLFETVTEKYSLPITPKQFILYIFHPVSFECGSIQMQASLTLKKILAKNLPVICILPNTDAGADEVMMAYQNISHDNQVFYIKNFQQADYLTILQNARCLIGNSSSGIIEAASFHVPVLNVGSRQQGRERSGNVIDVTPDPADIESGIDLLFSADFQKKVNEVRNVYGAGKTTEKIINTLENIEITPQLTSKRISY
ncbi:UDP-N-acetylglucosamine 2-epimerase [Falsibacillus albus]|uniref:UDP-N-acetylglucosamine 2-epimerase (Hydrolyzing) n=1 Tax=Falsibacillus albus TaxID=2478915 RepID=A0A3L7K4E8_9BACI|nr:UDP-N-acetylglucosamine 2-epimerase [Falsibacillus albus]RLQ97144.1 UDP-N-acetylglucosamine 2-epimerase (hydrolyzing) [Falsibacillus albus]